MNATAYLRGLVRRAVVQALTATTSALARLQVEADDATDDGVEHWSPFGLASWPKAGAEALLLAIGGDVEHAAALSADARYVPALAAEGDVALHNAHGRVLYLGTTGKLGTGATKAIARSGDTVSVTIPAGTVCVGVSAGAAVMNPSPITLSGTITSGSSLWKAED